MQLIFSAVVGIILMVFLVGSFTIDNTTTASDVLRPQGFPLIFAIIGLFLLALDTVGTIRKIIAAKSKEKESTEVFNKEGYKRTGLTVLLLLLYIVLVDVIGFIITTFLFVFAAAWVIGYKKWKVLGIFTIALTVMMVVVFGNIFAIPLPRGVGIFRELSFFIY